MHSPRASRVRAFAAKLCGFLRRQPDEREFEDEIQDHLQRLIEGFVAQGMSRSPGNFPSPTPAGARASRRYVTTS